MVPTGPLGRSTDPKTANFSQSFCGMRKMTHQIVFNDTLSSFFGALHFFQIVEIFATLISNEYRPDAKSGKTKSVVGRDFEQRSKTILVSQWRVFFFKQ